jgi:hypothetical protein
MNQINHSLKIIWLFQLWTNQIIEQNLSLVFHSVDNWNRYSIAWLKTLDSTKNELKGISSDDNNRNSIFIILDPQTSIQQNRLTCSLYDQKTGLFDDKHYRVLTRIISLTIDKSDSIHNVKINFPIVEKNHSIICAYWKIFDNMTAQWSTEGCYLENMTNSTVTCVCNHLTHFAILMVCKTREEICWEIIHLFRILNKNQHRNL